MDEQINEMKTMIKKAISSGIAKIKTARKNKMDVELAKMYGKSQRSAHIRNRKLKAMFDPKSSFRPSGKSNLEKPRAIKAQLAIDKVKV